MSLGELFIVAAPSGAGKTSLVSAALDQCDDLMVSISYTTRAKRPNEVDGQDYFFISPEQFTEMAATGEFLEHATVFNYHYGTSKSWVQKKLSEGVDIILEIDWQGADQVISLFPNANSIFILPPSLDILRQRLLHRAQDAPDTIEHRMQKAKEEISHYLEFQFIVINDNFAKALTDIVTIIRGQRLKLVRQSQKHQQLLSNLA